MTTLTQRLEEIALRLEKATPGPWQIGYTDGSGKLDLDEREFCVSAGKSIPVIHANLWSDNDEENSANAGLIANAPADLALLLRIVREQDEALGKVDAQCSITSSIGKIARECRERVRQMCEGEA